MKLDRMPVFTMDASDPSAGGRWVDKPWYGGGKGKPPAPAEQLHFEGVVAPAAEQQGHDVRDARPDPPERRVRSPRPLRGETAPGAAGRRHRAGVLKFLATPEALDLSDFEVAARLGVSRALVTSCWREHYAAVDGGRRFADPIVWPEPDPEPDPEPAAPDDEEVLARRIATWYRWQARRRDLGLPARGRRERRAAAVLRGRADFPSG